MTNIEDEKKESPLEESGEEAGQEIEETMLEGMKSGDEVMGGGDPDANDCPAM